MRTSSTLAEQRVWRWLRDRRFLGYKFRRQYPIGPYILDFYSATLKLAIEIDGAHHESPDMHEYDSERTFRLQEHGIEVLRIPNELIRLNTLLAGECIQWAIERREKQLGCVRPAIVEKPRRTFRASSKFERRRR